MKNPTGTTRTRLGAGTLALLGALSLFGCTQRTSISAVPRPKPQEPAYVAQGGCNVRDYTAATDVPSGARNLGWVRVEQQESDEATFVALRQKICELGGDALSQAAWVKDPGEERPYLQAHAWELP
jgi:hypothetical protein